MRQTIRFPSALPSRFFALAPGILQTTIPEKGKKASHYCRKAILLFMALTIITGQQGASWAAPQPVALLPPEVIENWTKAGARIGFIGREKGEGLEFRSQVIEPEFGELPTFQIRDWKTGMLAQRLAPPVPFGLWLSNTTVGDADLKALVGFPKLQALVLWGTKVTDAGLKELASCENLKELYIGGRHITDRGCKELAALTQLQSLSLADTHVTDVGLKELAALKQLQALSLSGTRISDIGLKELAGLKQIEYLDLTDATISDTGLQYLAGYHKLRVLILCGTAISDAGLDELTLLKKLQHLDLYPTNVSEKKVNKLKKAIPGLSVRGYRDILRRKTEVSFRGCNWCLGTLPWRSNVRRCRAVPADSENVLDFSQYLFCCV
jgi:Leucine rich repeat